MAERSKVLAWACIAVLYGCSGASGTLDFGGDGAPGSSMTPGGGDASSGAGDAAGKDAGDATTTMETGPDADASGDTGEGQDANSRGDGGMDSGEEHDSGADVDAGMDSGESADSGTDGGVDSGEPLDSGADAGADAEADSGADAGADAGTPCTGLCSQQQTCPGGTTTAITGTVYAPNGSDPLPGVQVYVPNGGLPATYGVRAFTPGVSCSACGGDVSGSPLVQTVSKFDGSFEVDNMPVGTNIPLVIQIGRWRRQFTIPNVPSCVTTDLSTTGMPQTRLPQTQAEGDIPLIAIVTGSVDSLECELRKIGIADTEFTDPGGGGRVNFYQGDQGAGGAVISPSTPDESQLWSLQAEINQYDVVLFPCKGADLARTVGAQEVVRAFANAGGRIYATHYSYDWLYNNGDFATTANWAIDPNDQNVFANDPSTAFIVTPPGGVLTQWLSSLGASTTLGQIPIGVLRNDFTGVVAPSELWLYVNDPTLGNNVPMQYTFGTPVSMPTADQCGKVAYTDYHVEDSSNNPTTGMTFPTECQGGAETPQEQLLEYNLFDLDSCVLQ